MAADDLATAGPAPAATATPSSRPRLALLGAGHTGRTVADLIERTGYDAVRLESLRAGRLLQPGGRVFGVSLGRTEFARALAG